MTVSLAVCMGKVSAIFSKTSPCERGHIDNVGVGSELVHGWARRRHPYVALNTRFRNHPIGGLATELSGELLERPPKDASALPPCTPGNRQTASGQLLPYGASCFALMTVVGPLGATPSKQTPSSPTSTAAMVEIGRSAVRGVAARKLPFSTAIPGAPLNVSPAKWIDSTRVSFERAPQ
jgi:hypothetical protein